MVKCAMKSINRVVSVAVLFLFLRAQVTELRNLLHKCIHSLLCISSCGGQRVDPGCNDYLVLHSSVVIYVLLFTGGCKRWSIGIISYLKLL